MNYELKDFKNFLVSYLQFSTVSFLAVLDTISF